MSKKKLDKLSADMIECEKAGYGCHYGAWKAAQNNPVIVQKKAPQIPEDWRVCEYCGKPYLPKTRRPQKYCQSYCQLEAQKKAARKKRREYMRKYRAERGAEGGEQKTAG